MKGLLVGICSMLAAVFWMSNVGPWIARLCGIPVRKTFEITGRQQNLRLTRLQFVWGIGVLVFGVGTFIMSFGSYTLQRIFLEKRWSARLFDLGVALLISFLIGIVIAFLRPPARNGGYGIIRLNLSQRK